MRFTCSILAALGAGMSFLPLIARAEVPGNAGTKAVLTVSTQATEGRFDFTGDKDWYRVDLVAGRDYAVSGNCTRCTFDLRDPAGKMIHRQGASGFEEESFEFRPKVSGTYLVEYVQQPAGLGEDNGDYEARVSFDCRGDAGTRCVLKPGATFREITAGSVEQDWYKASLKKGGSYTVRLSPGLFTFLRIVIAGGEVLAQGQRDTSLPGSYGVSVKAFHPPADGTYYVVVEGADEAEAPYKLNLATP